MTNAFTLYLGPKKPVLLQQLGSEKTTLDRLFYLGWPIFAIPASIMQVVLHFFHDIIPNYGLNIIMLTVLVRSLMFPLSKKQALSAAKMQELQPEVKRLNEKYKDNSQARGQAMMELYRKHSFNPLGGCLPAFIQLPIFMGLYRALMTDVELRAAPLFGESIRWCSNFGALICSCTGSRIYQSFWAAQTVTSAPI